MADIRCRHTYAAKRNQVTEIFQVIQEPSVRAHEFATGDEKRIPLQLRRAGHRPDQ
jgi:hypothetical protein